MMRRIDRDQETGEFRKVEVQEKIEENKEEHKEENVEDNRPSHKLLKIMVLIVIIILAFFYYMRFIETNMLFVKEIKITNEKLPIEFHGYKIIQFSDVHYLMSTDFKYMKKLVDKINNINPDVIVFTGDLLDKSIDYKDDDLDNLSNLLKEINSNYKYYIKGEHDYQSEKSEIVLRNANFRGLNNDYQYVYNRNESKIVINGLGRVWIMILFQIKLLILQMTIDM